MRVAARTCRFALATVDEHNPQSMALTLNSDQWVTVLVAALGLIGTLGGVWLQNRHADRIAAAELDERRRAQTDTELARWRNDSARAIGDARELLVDINPMRVMVNIRLERATEDYQELQNRWGLVRQSLARLGGHPSADVARLADDTVAWIHRTMSLVGWTMQERVANRDWRDLESDAQDCHGRAARSLEQLRHALRGEPVEPEPADEDGKHAAPQGEEA
jgi:hypothetical protein